MEQSSTSSSSSNISQSATSMESLIAEAVAYGDDENEVCSKSLECPCIADLRSGHVGFSFQRRFFCFLKSTSEEKGSDCVHPFVALQNCIKANPDAFSKEVLEDDEVKKEGKSHLMNRSYSSCVVQGT
ncbi:hypothetical protein LWI28_020075 [Acer negundo]|uniref:Uncharacterized protein n=1 Tax=Acer negundo TaxID=4023 RepID=A0AAD5IMJ5_ACENE|nr:hypothetical protein LWI28_020075 [Acer negundo]